MTAKADNDASPLVHHEAIGYEIRRGGYLEHAASTYTLAEMAVREGRFEAGRARLHARIILARIAAGRHGLPPGG